MAGTESTESSSKPERIVNQTLVQRTRYMNLSKKLPAREPLRSPTPTKRRYWLFRLVALGVPTSIGLVLISGLLIHQGRLAIDNENGLVIQTTQPIYLEEPGHEVTGHRYLYDSQLGWRNIPNWHSKTNGRTLTINSRGLRDREYPLDKPAGVRRILVLGDSYAWGYGVSDDEIFTEILEQKLSLNDSKWQVLNSGVSGWGTDQQYLYLKEEGIHYEPDVVVLAFFLLNDPENNTHSRQYGLNKPLFLDPDLTLVNVPVPSPFDVSEELESNGEPLEITFAIIDAISRLCVDRSIPLIISKFGLTLKPDADGLKEIDRLFSEHIRFDCPELLLLDLDEAFIGRGISARQLLEGNDDGHWNAYGHEKVGEVLFDFMTAQGIVTGEI